MNLKKIMMAQNKRSIFFFVALLVLFILLWSNKKFSSKLDTVSKIDIVAKNITQAQDKAKKTTRVKQASFSPATKKEKDFPREISHLGLSAKKLTFFLNKKIKPEHEIIFDAIEDISLGKALKEYNLGAVAGLASADPIIAKVTIDMLMAKYKETNIAVFSKEFTEYAKEISRTKRYKMMTKLIGGDDKDIGTYSFMVEELWNDGNMSDSKFESLAKGSS